MADEYGKTLNLPKTEFPMRASLPVREPEILEKWNGMDLYNRMVKEHEGMPKHILHDGPPFANGNIHIGHVLNKILKDIVVKYKSMTGHQSLYVPGWDTHGLPIEQQAITKLKIDKSEMNHADFRKLCRDFAMKYVNNQREQFKRLGVVGDWEHPYLTLAPEFEECQIGVFGEMVKKGFIYRGLKPVYWCPDCETALAEAEIEYKDDTTESIYVKFKVADDKGKINLPNSYFVIWTTTTWTIPGNTAIALNPRFEYAAVRVGDEHFIVATELVETFMKVVGIAEYEVVKKFSGEDLEYVECEHPLFDRKSLVILGDHVTLEAGTGCVHTAPGHGAEDYVACKKYPEVPIVVPVDTKGHLNEEAGEFNGVFYAKANKLIAEALKERGLLLSSVVINHSYPHCWRCRNPIIYRAAEQWFASINDFKEETLEAIRNVKWVPAWGEERISSMVRERDDWCISRQRLWGMPIPIFYCEECGEPILDVELINRVAEIFGKRGSNAWFEEPAETFMPDGYKCKCGGSKFRKETDTMDVWFDSGTSHVEVLEKREEQRSPADLYLEGNDQYRGWFQSSLLTSVAHSGRAPYKAVLTHGFVIDEEKKKMSKSLGNGLPPDEIIKEYGVDILRLWTVSSDYKSDIRISKEILKQLSEMYRKIRNTARFILGNISDFDPSVDMVAAGELSELDRWALHRTNKLIEKVLSAYEDYDYHILYHAIHNFCVVDMSNFYLDVMKDRLYTEKSDSRERRGTQTVMYRVLDTLTRLLAPVLSFTAEEIWGYMPGEKKESVLLAEMPSVEECGFGEELVEKWDRILALRDVVSKALESARGEKLIGNSLEAHVKLMAHGEEYEFIKSVFGELEQVFIVSGVELDELEEKGDVKVEVSRTSGEKCPRCWMYRELKDGLCERCTNVVHGE